MRNSRGEKKNFLGVLAPSLGEFFFMGLASSSRRAISRGGGTMRNSRGEKKFFLGVLAPSHGELKKFSGDWLLLFVIINLEEGGAP